MEPRGNALLFRKAIPFCVVGEIILCGGRYLFQSGGVLKGRDGFHEVKYVEKGWENSFGYFKGPLKTSRIHQPKIGAVFYCR